MCSTSNNFVENEILTVRDSEIEKLAASGRDGNEKPIVGDLLVKYFLC